MAITIDILRLGEVRLPSSHPRAAVGTCPIHAAVVHHPDGPILFDTGAADDHPFIVDLYRPEVVRLVDALHSIGVDERDVVAIVNSHLHFDHCGQNRALPGVPVWVQRSEYELVDEPLFTVPDWARLTDDRRRIVDGDASLADGVRIVATPGHTPGHQSLAVDTADGLAILGGQCCYDSDEFGAAVIDPNDAHGSEWVEAGLDSLRRLHDLRPEVVHLSHDHHAWRAP